MRKSVKRLVASRANYRCEYCFSPLDFSPDPYSIDHINPQGGDDSDNLAFSCQGCNNYKHKDTHAHDPVTNERVALYHPRLQNWSDHFVWIEDFSKIEGISIIGRATVHKLQLNRVGLVNLRNLLHQYGKHP